MKICSIRHSWFAKAMGAATLLSLASMAPALTIYTASVDASLISPPAVNNQYGFASFKGTGIDNGSSSGNAFDAGSTQVFDTPLRVRGQANVNGSTDLPGGVSQHSASTTGHLNLGNLSGPGNPTFPNPVPYTATLLLEWSYTITVSCTLADEIATATVYAQVAGGPSLAPVTLTQVGPGSATLTLTGSTPYNVVIPGFSVKSVFLDVHADGFSITPPVPEPSSLMALGLGALGLLRRRPVAKRA